MVRAMGLLVMTGGFLLISPNLRNNVMDGLSKASIGLETYSPMSYVGLGFGLVLLMLILLYKASQPR
jgi:hypothetical protein